MAKEANEAAHYEASEVDISQGFPAVKETPKVEEKTEEVKKEEPKASDDEKAVTERLKQQNARQAKLLAGLGIDPASDIAEQFESGVITEDMVRQHVLGKKEEETVPQKTESNDPVDIAQNEYDRAKAAYDKEAESGGISIATNNAYLSAMQKLSDAKLDRIEGQVTAERTAQQVDRNVTAVLNIARQAPEYEKMSDELKSSSDTVNIAMTGIIADREARRMGLNPARLTTQQYEYFANKATEELGALRDYFVELGRQEVRASLTPSNTKNVIPAPGTGGDVVPLINPYGNVKISNHQDAARKYMHSAGAAL
jgi:hypothetical protein